MPRGNKNGVSPLVTSENSDVSDEPEKLKRNAGAKSKGSAQKDRNKKEFSGETNTESNSEGSNDLRIVKKKKLTHSSTPPMITRNSGKSKKNLRANPRLTSDRNNNAEKESSLSDSSESESEEEDEVVLSQGESNDKDEPQPSTSLGITHAQPPTILNPELMQQIQDICQAANSQMEDRLFQRMVDAQKQTQADQVHVEVDVQRTPEKRFVPGECNKQVTTVGPEHTAIASQLEQMTVTSPSSATVYTTVAVPASENETSAVDLNTGDNEGINKSSDDSMEMSVIANQSISEIAGSGRKRTEPGQHGSTATPSKRPRSVVTAPEQESHIDREIREAREKVERTVREAENRKAELLRPTGESFKDNLDSDSDNEFDLGYYLDDSTKEKIAAGKYVDLKRLLPQDVTSFLAEEDEKPLQMVNKGGYTYMTPARDGVSEITSYRRWESAFKVYTGIYVQANPSRAPEILQYSYSIESAAQTYTWRNVYAYDKLLRHKMEKKPTRSWAKVHQRGWFMFMRDHLAANHKTGENSGGGSTGNKKKKLCWKFNKFGKCDYGKNCSFDHRCKHCGSPNHPGCKCTAKRGGNKDKDKEAKKNQN